ncbi:MFS transporter [Longispora fulva]|uniref:MFS family permease n=1 Tax=Longispora fulva TaxID=619741 RepID=A0A8J7GFB5_9ACTN|nr:MFS transporter [Longispora fulva]MBG6137769.1 MFS family permease [Longispora fulva]
MRIPLPAVLREERQFALLFAGQALSTLGDRVTFVALPFAVLAIGGTAADVGWVIAAATVPFLLFTLVGGVWADRLPRHRVMLVSDVVRCGTQVVAATLLAGGDARVWHLVALMAIFGTADAFFSPALAGLVPLTVRPERLQEANALRGLVMSAGLVAGPALAGGLVVAFGPGGALAADAATFAVSAVFLARLRPRAGAPERAGDFLAELRDGFRAVRSRSWVWSTLTATAVYHLVVLPSVFVLGPVLAERELGGASGWAVVVAAFGVGSIVGDVVALRWRPGRPLLVAAAALAVGSCQALIIGGGGSLAVIAVLEGVTGVAVSLCFTLWETALQTHIPEGSLSRVTSFDLLVTVGSMPVGMALAGPAADAFGLHPTLAVMTLVGVPSALALFAVRGVRRLSAVAEPGT